LGVAQKNQPIDSLNRLLTHAKSDSERVIIYVKLSENTPDFKESTAYLQKGFLLANRIHYEAGIIECGLKIGFNLVDLDYYKAIPHLLKIKNICEKNREGYKLQLAQSIGLLGYAYNKFDRKKSIQHYNECRKLMQKYNFSELDLAINLLTATHYKLWGPIDSSLYYLQKSYLSYKDDKPAPSNLYYRVFGELYYKKGDKGRAMDYFRRSITTQNRYRDGEAYQGIAVLFQERNQLDSARFYAKEALQIHLKTNRKIYIVEAATLLFKLTKQSNPAEAINYLLLAAANKDSLQDREKAREVERVAFEEQEREASLQRNLKANQLAYENRLKLYSLLGVLAGALLLTYILYRNNRQKQKANVLLKKQRDEINYQRDKAENALRDLQATQAQLIQKEKLASLGELTAGIAHEIQNPLNFVNNFSELSVDLADELENEIKKPELDRDLIADLTKDIKSNQEKINLHGKRASSIVKGMLEHSRTSTGERQLTDINKLADEYLRLSYHGLRAKDSSFNSDYELISDEHLPNIEVVPQEIGRVLLNLINNAFYAVNERAKQGEANYQPKVTVTTQTTDNQLEIQVQDNGTGIPESVKAKIFQPFFTTKPTGEGTGLGLSLAYDIVTKGHGGTLTVASNEGEGATFTLTLPLQVD